MLDLERTVGKTAVLVTTYEQFLELAEAVLSAEPNRNSVWTYNGCSVKSHYDKDWFYRQSSVCLHTRMHEVGCMQYTNIEYFLENHFNILNFESLVDCTYACCIEDGAIKALFD